MIFSYRIWPRQAIRNLCSCIPQHRAPGGNCIQSQSYSLLSLRQRKTFITGPKDPYIGADYNKKFPIYWKLQQVQLAKHKGLSLVNKRRSTCVKIASCIELQHMPIRYISEKQGWSLAADDHMLDELDEYPSIDSSG